MGCETIPKTQSEGQNAEYWDLFDKDGNFVRTMQRGRGFVPPELYHVTVEIIATDRKGHMLVTRRALSKKRDAGYWEFPAGSVLANEKPEAAALRELYEETGLRPESITKFHVARIPGLQRIAYLATIPNLCQETVRLQEGETMGYQYVTVLQWHQMISSGFYSSSRLRLYTKAFYQGVEQYVGVLDELPKASSKPKHVIRSVKFGGE